MIVELPRGFTAHVTNVGIKDSSDDFTLVAADSTCSAAGVFTQSRFAGPSVVVSREHLRGGRARSVVVISKNANVATGATGMANAREVVAGVASALGCHASEVLIASTGVIGRQYPMDAVRAGLAAIPKTLRDTNAESVARGIMTTDTVHKIAEAQVAGSTSRVVGVAKGVGMIEPNMATLITMLFTDAAIEPNELDAMFRRVIDKTFNCVSVDTDTSTSDSAIVLASGAAGAVDHAHQAGGTGRRRCREAHRGARRARTRRTSGEGGRQGDRQLPARQDRRARGGPELGPRRHGDRQVQRVRRYRPGPRRHLLR
jgi:glutamate N-acetyltransferase/amino-acid N-acetyltransferase